MSDATPMATADRSAQGQSSDRDRSAFQRDQSSAYRNVGEDERFFSMLGGLALSLYGLRCGSWLGAASFLSGAALIHRGWAGYCSLYDQLGINTRAGSYPRGGVRARHGQRVERTIHVGRDRRDVYGFWENLQNLPRVMRHLKSVTPVNDRRSQWVAHAPLGQTLQWEAEIINARPGELIAWQSVDGSQVDTAGSVHFSDSPSGAGTVLVVSLKYDPPGGQFAETLAHLLGRGLEDELESDLLAFKQALEAGEITPGERPAAGQL